MPYRHANGLNKIPFARLLVCLIAGIHLQWRVQLGFNYLLVNLIVFAGLAVLYSAFAVTVKFRVSYLSGSFISIALINMGAVLVQLKDTRNNALWVGHHYIQGSYILATIEEPPVEKANTWKVTASIQSMITNKKEKAVIGKVILYFKKDSSVNKLHYGSQIIFKNAIQPVRNTSNPGSFDYRNYCLFQGITHQVYLSSNDFELLPLQNKSRFRAFILECSKWTLETLQKFIPGKKEQGLAEALLIGYKNDLDKSLVEAYSNTGVVHVIAISGLHLGLIYSLLLLVTKPLNRKKHLACLRLVIILLPLWLFTILAGAQPSVLRSAVMFSFVALSEVINRKGSVLNTLALSAFVLLCFNPFWLWDVGFQLSYAAVLSILIFFRPVYNWIYFENKLLDIIWKLNAVTISAQLLTLPVSIYHFHQLPVLFLFTNLVAVPLSSLILLAEILLCILFFVPLAANILGMLIHWMIRCMNSYIERWDAVSFSIWTGLSISVIQTIFLTAFTIFFCCWLMEMKKHLLWMSVVSLLFFVSIRSVSLIEAGQQKKLVVYNVPKHQSIDLVQGRQCGFIGDTDLEENEFLIDFYLQPSRVLNRIQQIHPVALKSFEFCSKNILILDSDAPFLDPANSRIDLLILSGNPRFFVPRFIEDFSVGQIVIDGSVPAWKSRVWKKDCDSLRIPCHVVSEQGAFVMDLNPKL